MKKIGKITGYDIYIASKEDPEIPDLTEFSDANGLTVFDSKRIYIREDVHSTERLTCLGHEIAHAYMEKWGLYNLFSLSQREMLAQFFGSMLVDLLLENKIQFNELWVQLANLEGDENGTQRTKAVSKG